MSQSTKSPAASVGVTTPVESPVGVETAPSPVAAGVSTPEAQPADRSGGQPGAPAGGTGQFEGLDPAARRVFVGLMLGMLVASISQTIVSPAMPRIVAELGGMEHYSWIATAAMLVSALLFGLVSIVGVAGGYYFNVVLQGVTPGAYIQGFSALSKPTDLIVGFVKAILFGLAAGVVAAYRGLNPSGGPKGVGDAVNQAVVITFVLLFAINVIVTAVYLNLVPPNKF